MSETTSLEKKIVAAALKDRAAYDKIIGASDVDTTYTPYGSQLLKLAGEFYSKDSKATSVDGDVLRAWIEVKIASKNQELYKAYLAQIESLDVSAINISDLVVSTRKRTIGNQLAAALLDDKDSAKIAELQEQYSNLSIIESRDEEDVEEIYHNRPISEMVERAQDQAGIIRLLPKSLDAACKGRVKRGHHLVIFARPETGKTAITLTMAKGFALQKLSGIIFGNEEPVSDVEDRARCCLTGWTREQILANPEKAQTLLDKAGWQYIRFIPLTPGTPKQIEAYVKKYKPAWFVVDQIRNLAVGQETRVNQLEMAATAVRNIAKRNDCLGISITQSGDSGEQKLVLDMGDIDFSNTGIPATADVMLGMGVNKEYDAQGLRMLATPKNKVGGSHTHWQVRINPLTSTLEDM